MREHALGRLDREFFTGFYAGLMGGVVIGWVTAAIVAIPAIIVGNILMGAK